MARCCRPVYVFHLTRQKMARGDIVLAKEGVIQTRGRSTESGDPVGIRAAADVGKGDGGVP